MSSGERTRIAKRAFNDVDSAVNKVWPTVVRLGQLPGVVDLGQGWPNLAEDSAIVARRAAAQAITESTDRKVNQYSPIPGRPELQQSISKYYERAYGIELASATEIAITTSGTEALYATIMALVDPGDEVIMFEPFFPWYAAHVKLAGGVCKAITLQPPQFGIDDSAILAIKAAITPKTKLLMFNSPHNPSGHVASKEELQQLSEICVQNSLLVLSDEVYEGCTFPSAKVKHYRLSEFEGMKERTVTVGSASKLFSLCGWRVGWITGPEDLVGAAKSIHGYTTYCAPTPLMLGVAAAFDAEDGTFEGVGELFEGNHAMLQKALEECGLLVCPAQGGYFLLADVAATGMSDFEFVQWLAENVKVVCVPLQVFYVNTPERCTLIRFSVCKSREIMNQACAVLRTHKETILEVITAAK